MVVVHLQCNFASQLSFGKSQVTTLAQFKLLCIQCIAKRTAPNTQVHQRSASLFMSIMTLRVPPNPCCSCMLAVVELLRMYFGYVLCDTQY